MENIKIFFNDVLTKFKELWVMPLSNLTIPHIIILAMTAIACFFAVKFLLNILKFLFIGIGRSGKATFSAKAKCKQIQCDVCGRTLDKCTCAKNANKSYLGRLRAYKKKKRLQKKKLKEAIN